MKINIYKEVMKTLDFVLVRTQQLFNRLLSLVQGGNVNSKLYSNAVIYIVNPKN